MYLTRRFVLPLMMSLLLVAPLAAKTVNYSPEKRAGLLSSSKPVLLDFYTDWCSTCRTQQRAISKLLKQEGDFADVIWVKINWDQYRNSKLSKDLKIPRRSVLVMLKNGKETGRVVAQTSSRTIEKLIRSGL